MTWEQFKAAIQEADGGKVRLRVIPHPRQISLRQLGGKRVTVILADIGSPLDEMGHIVRFGGGLKMAVHHRDLEK